MDEEAVKREAAELVAVRLVEEREEEGSSSPEGCLAVSRESCLGVERRWRGRRPLDEDLQNGDASQMALEGQEEHL